MADQRWSAATGIGVVLRFLRNQRARDCRTGPGYARADDENSVSPIEGALLFPLSSTSADALRKTAHRLADWVDAHTQDISAADLGYTLARRRAHRPVRTSVTAGSLPELTVALREIADDEIPYQPAAGRDDHGPVWLFSGQGSQWAAMGAELLANEPVFAATIARIEPLIATESGFSVTEAISATEVVTGIDRVQPTIFAMQVALADTMKAYGVTPGAVIGHSMERPRPPWSQGCSRSKTAFTSSAAARG